MANGPLDVPSVNTVTCASVLRASETMTAGTTHGLRAHSLTPLSSGLTISGMLRRPSVRGWEDDDRIESIAQSTIPFGWRQSVCFDLTVSRRRMRSEHLR